MGKQSGQYSGRQKTGSALILTVVLTSLLALVGVLFAMVSRLDKNTARSLGDSRRLDLAVESLLVEIGDKLITDIPDINDSGGEKQEYWDAPDLFNPWLASSEPYRKDGIICWEQISDVTGYLEGRQWANRNVPVNTLVADNDAIRVEDGVLAEQPADADGDGVADAKWFVLNDRDVQNPIYAAVRIVDHAGMVNINTAHTFPDVTGTTAPDRAAVDGSHQMQIDLLGLAARGSNDTALGELVKARTGIGDFPIDAWLREVVWSFDIPKTGYAPFDLTDELFLRYRYVIGNAQVHTRIKELWAAAFNTAAGPRVPFNTRSKTYNDVTAWFEWGTATDGMDAVHASGNYDYRHLCTTFNGERLIDPQGQAMIEINRQLADIAAARNIDPHGARALELVNELYLAIRDALLLNTPSDLRTAEVIEDRAAQFAVNLIDFHDDHRNDPNVTITCWTPPNTTGGKSYYGHEVQAFIRQVGFRIGDRENSDTSDLFLFELYNPFRDVVNVAGYRLDLYNADMVLQRTIYVGGDQAAGNTRLGHQESYLIVNDGSAAATMGLSVNTDQIAVDPGLVYVAYDQASPPTRNVSADIRFAVLGHPTYRSAGEESTVIIDVQDFNAIDFGYEASKGQSLFYARGDEAQGRSVFPRWSSDRMRQAGFIDPSLEDPDAGSVAIVDPNVRLEDPALVLGPERRFERVGDILRILTVGPDTEINNTIGQQIMDREEAEVRFDLSEFTVSDNGLTRAPAAALFQYLHVLDPNTWDADREEIRVKGRINVNTAPWFVLARLPWIDDEMAQDIVAFRTAQDRYAGNVPQVFQSIGDLMLVDDMRSLANDGKNGWYGATSLPRYPDFTTDNRIDDQEEAHLVFSAISNLATVRSDVFGAYLLVRMGAQGPQRRVFVLLDRTGSRQVWDSARGEYRPIAQMQTVVRQDVP
ncbi:hypothetical protein ACFL6U_17040 [Planctomycetota bacterium]